MPFSATRRAAPMPCQQHNSICGPVHKKPTNAIPSVGENCLAESEGFEPSCPGGQTHFECVTVNGLYWTLFDFSGL